MASISLMGSDLRLVFDAGMKGEKQIFKSKNLPHIKTTASPQQLVDTANAIASLQKLPLFSVERNDTNSILA
ncbi:hypothetical protein A374_17829 [Fictibacillus macauensis ZFHKF-1]|uniref:DUF1659 domain-containing protein n=1 Tax=Fictibacillus macauensis ZFHKF-1 TaxID=1196324 RepID=I8AEY8_9BACL|nr:DUF1659 domain-containing protein [Fictibacillus macauensis]EIT83919.1 hypothetical protein A374_17829 [Fictibacillus macauensis ZFHKF-1]